jgi:hypothetical protein
MVAGVLAPDGRDAPKVDPSRMGFSVSAVRLSCPIARRDDE